jgi:hypothetical protein
METAEIKARFELFTKMIQVEVFWVLTPCSDVSLKMEAARSFETLVSCHRITTQETATSTNEILRCVPDIAFMTRT